MGPLGVPEMMFIFVLALVLFGPKELPVIGRKIGKAMAEFRRASDELKSTFEREMSSLEQETEPLKQIASQYQNDTYNYDYSSYENTYEGSYGSETNDFTPSTTSASAPQGAESPTVVTPEGTVAHGSEIATVHGSSGNAPEGSATAGEDHLAAPPISTTTEHNA